AVTIGMPVRVTFRDVSDEIALPLFEPDPEASRPAPPPRAARPLTPAIRPGSDQHLERRAILSGVGQSQIGRRLFRTDLDLTCEAALAAIADAGLTTRDIDGLACYPGPMGTRRGRLGEIALPARAHAALHPAAVYREPLTMEDYLRARMVTWPFGLYDCDVPVDGSTAVVVSAADAARDLPHPAVRINAVGSAIRGRPVWDQWEDLTTMAARDAAAQLWARTDLTPADVDTIQLYDGFSWLTLAWIE